MRGRFDLHTHSTVSDGTEPPGTVVRQAAAAGLAGLALTDHDSTAGWADATAAAREAGVGLLPGVELSTRLGWRSVHVLGYLVDPAHPGLVAETERIRVSRRDRARRIVDAIAADYPLTWDDVVAQTAPGATVGRPHIADALVALGIEPDRSAAFAGVLHPRRGYVEPHYAPTPADGVALLRAAGGVPVLAHPGATRAEWVIPEEEVAALVDAGLFGIEADHPENTPGGGRLAAALAARFGLPVTGSSDYHGSGKPNRLGQRTTAPEVVDAIIEQGTGTDPVLP
ncbi:PHP domain-containing protein [Amnibacterium setariae]|uniref:PHP domain-containing protein n=1 Tax=Amnibacterium setariae TaxID=2306585 RepID=A0A3A1U502_9MICO|nr:PHP domain-containing protein [Amnibacterium setariae]RIX31412.1 PHP domain-containing protein [Amnibacterium setariae]